MPDCAVRGCDNPKNDLRLCAVHGDKMRADSRWLPIVDADPRRCGLCNAPVVVARRSGTSNLYALEVAPDGLCQLVDESTFVVLTAETRERLFDDCQRVGVPFVVYSNHKPRCPGMAE